jgi:hypothetical protein
MAEQRNDAEDRLLRRLRLACGYVSLGCMVLLLLADTFGRLLFDPSFHVSEILFGTLVGALVAFVGVEALVRIPKKDP